MSQQVKKKLCWNCEGQVQKSQETCPFCGVYLSPQAEDKNLIPEPSYQPEEEIKAVENKKEEKQDNLLLSLASTLFGVILFIFGLVVYLFSTNGKMTLSWSSDLGLIFLAISIPLLFLGFKNLNDS